jgi:metal-sulfur cluster biosynthetic enzyme
VLRTCYDPELPVNVVDLGLVYECKITPLPEGGNDVVVRMTLTSPGCPMSDYVQDEIEEKLLDTPGVKRARVEWVFDPPWDPSRMTEAARLDLGLI